MVQRLRAVLLCRHEDPSLNPQQWVWRQMNPKSPLASWSKSQASLKSLAYTGVLGPDIPTLQ